MNSIRNFNTIIYHNPCNDGAVSLWAANYYKDIPEKINCKAGSSPNFIPNGKNIIFVDLCPKFDYLFEISKLASNVVVLDHHKTALDAFELNKENCPSNLHIILDMERSGCQITWDYFHQQTPRPWFLNYVADRDLWAWRMPNSKEINQIFNENNMLDPCYLDNITKLLTYDSEQINELIQQGLILIKYNKKQLDLAASRALEASMEVNGQKYNIWLGTTTSTDRSELGNFLANKVLSSGNIPDFSATWIYEPKLNEWWISLRGTKTSPDLTLIAGFYEGGGHKLAVGFTIKSPKTLRDIFLIK